MIAFPFDSQITSYDANNRPVYDRASSAAQLAEWFQSYFKDGIFGDLGTKFQVLQGSGMAVTVKPGNGNIRGRYFTETEDTSLTVGTANATYPRIDTIVIRLNLNTSARSVALFVKPGTAASSPATPSLTRNASVWELGIANIRVNAGVTSIAQSAITDTRLSTSRCGVVAQAITTLATDTYYTQIAAALSELNARYDAQEAAVVAGMQGDRTEQMDLFTAWFATAQTVLGTDAAGELLNLINSITPTDKTATLYSATGAAGTAGVWSGSAAPFLQVVTVSGMTANKKVSVGLAPGATQAQYEAAASAGLFAASQASNTLTIKAFGTRPTVNIPIAIRMEG